jgi:hypothetical protein
MADIAAAGFVAAVTVLAARDVDRSVTHNRDVLGFRVAFTHGEPMCYAGVERGGVLIHLQAASDTTRPPGHGAVYVFVDDVDAVYEELRARGARARTARRTTTTACAVSTCTTSTSTSSHSGWNRSARTSARRQGTGRGAAGILRPR